MRRTITLPDDLDARLKDEAKRRGITVSALAREAIEILLAAPSGSRLLAAGSGASGRADISERIEEILANELGS